MNKRLLKDGLGYGVMIWIIGYVLGILLFSVVPSDMIGWVIMPFGIAVTLWILIKKIHSTSLRYYGMIAFIWTSIAIIFDDLFLVSIFHPADGYYKFDVYLYYILMIVLPLIVGWRKSMKKGR